MIFIHRSNSLHKLAEKLGHELSGERLSDPFHSRQIIVPNRETARWLKLRLAEQNGILANVSFLLPAEWQFRQVRKLYCGLPSVLPGDPGPLTWAIFEMLMENNLREKLARPYHYLQGQPESMKERVAMQLAAKIASVYDQYLVYRPELILKWQANGPSGGSDEMWQAELWNQLEKKRYLREQGTGFPNKAELLKETADALEAGQIKPDQKILFFNPGLIPLPVLNIAEKASAHSDFAIYQLVVSKAADTDAGNELLEAFGEESKGIELMLNSLDATTEYHYAEPAGSKDLLEWVQEKIISGDPLDKSGNKLSGMELSGIEVHSCHSSMREIEVLHQFILRKLEEDTHLHPDDFLVVTPSIESYKPFIHAVFNSAQEGLPTIPYHVDFDRSSEQDIAGPFMQLLDIVDSRFQFNEVMDLFLEPAVRESFEISAFDAHRIKNWMKENNVVWGLDGDHRQNQDQPDDEAQTWQAALSRGWQGILFGEQENPFDEKSALRFHQIRGRERQDAWGGFSKYMRALKNFTRISREKRLPGEWCDLVENRAALFFNNASGSGGNNNPVRSALDKLREECKVSGTERTVSFSLFRSRLRKMLNQQSASSAIFTRGVAFSSMVPVRSIPAKVIALIGLNESDFPRKPNKIDFDLMAQNPEPTDRNPKNQDRSLFLESVLAAREVHYCSYIGRSKIDNEVIPPSPIVSEWLSHLSNLTGKKAEEILVEEPLHGFSPANFRLKRSFSVPSYKTAQSIAKNRDTKNGVVCREELPPESEAEAMSMDDLLRYMQNPARAFLKKRFNPSLNDPDETKNEFELNTLERHTSFGQIFGWRLQGKSEQEILSIFKKSGIIPAGWQGDREASELVKAADTAIASAREMNFELKDSLLEIDLEIGNKRVIGAITSYADKQFLDITSSAARGSNLLKSWIKHLFLQVSDLLPQKESFFLCELKKGSPAWYQFLPVGDPGQKLEQFIEIYQKGLVMPDLFFPNASYKYEKAVVEKKDNGFSGAKNSFEGSDFVPYSDNMDPYVKLFLGDDAKFKMQFLVPEVQAAVHTMLQHTERP